MWGLHIGNIRAFIDCYRRGWIFFLYSGSLISVTVGYKSTSRGLSISPFDTCNGILVFANRTIALQNEWNQKPTWSWCNMLHIYLVLFVPASTYWHRHPHSFQRQHPLRQMAHESTSLTAINRRSKCDHGYFFSLLNLYAWIKMQLQRQWVALERASSTNQFHNR